MDWGMKNRLAQIIKSDGKCFFMPIDHGYFLGPTSKLEGPGETLKSIVRYSDALFVTRGVLRSCIDPDNSLPIILRVSGGSSVIGKDLANESITTSIEEAIRLNVSAVGLSIFVGSEHEHQTLMCLGSLVNEGQRYGMPVLAVTAVGKEMGRDVRYLSLASRIAAELGAARSGCRPMTTGSPSSKLMRANSSPTRANAAAPTGCRWTSTMPRRAGLCMTTPISIAHAGRH